MKFQSIVVALAAAMLMAAGSILPASAARAHETAPATSPQALCLTSAEVNATLGGTFTPMPGRSIGNMGPGISGLQIVKKAGLVKGYGVTYTRQRPGETMVMSGVNLFRSTAEAHSSIERVLRAYGTASSRRAGVQATATHDLGDSDVTLHFQQSVEHGAVLHGLGVVFSRGRYAADVMIYATSAVDRGKVLSLARSVDRRIQNA